MRILLMLALLGGAARAQAVPQEDDDEIPPGTPVRVEPPPEIVEPPPPPTKTVRQHRWNLFTAGTCMLAGGWMASAVPGGVAGQYRLLAPLVGPYLQIPHFSTGGNPISFMVEGVLVLDGVVQAAGLAMLIAGVTTRRDVKVPIEVMPSASAGGFGVLVAGRF